MNAPESERLWQLVRRLQRQPEAPDDAEAQRALTVLLASRRDAAYLLLQRALVLELAWARVQAAQAGPADAPPNAMAPAASASARASPFVRDAATIAAGVVAGGLVLGGLGRIGEALADEVGTDLDLF